MTPRAVAREALEMGWHVAAIGAPFMHPRWRRLCVAFLLAGAAYHAASVVRDMPPGNAAPLVR